MKKKAPGPVTRPAILSLILAIWGLIRAIVGFILAILGLVFAGFAKMLPRNARDHRNSVCGVVC